MHVNMAGLGFMIIGISIALLPESDNEDRKISQESWEFSYEDYAVRTAYEKGYWPIEKYIINSNRQNPYYLRADFDGDGETDVAVRVINRETGAHAIIFVNTSQDTSWVVGDGQRDPETGLQLAGPYMRVIPKGTNIRYHASPEPDLKLDYFTLQHDGLEVGRRETFAVLYYWQNGIYDMLVIRD